MFLRRLSFSHYWPFPFMNRICASIWSYPLYFFYQWFIVFLYKSSTSFVKLIPKYLLFKGTLINGIFKIVFSSVKSFAYWKAIHECALSLYKTTIVYHYIVLRSFLVNSVMFSKIIIYLQIIRVWLTFCSEFP